MSERLILGTRGSQLAQAQSGQVARSIERASDGAVEVVLRVISTRGDRIQDRPLPEIGGKGLFTLEIETALREGGIDLAVHSLKDLPVENPEGLCLGAIPDRADPRDFLVGGPLDQLAAGAVVGTGSARRGNQLRALRPDLEVRGIRGNVDTRLRKWKEEDYDAIVLACAGLDRLGLSPPGAAMTTELSLPAAGQGALAVQCRAGDGRVLACLAPIESSATRVCVEAERAFLEALGGGCSLPVGAFAELRDGRLGLTGLVAIQGEPVRREQVDVPVERAIAAAREMAIRLSA